MYKLSGADAFVTRWEERQQPSVKAEEAPERDSNPAPSANSSGLRVHAAAGTAGTAQEDHTILSRFKGQRLKSWMQGMREWFAPRRAMFE